jgi:hypothetical protein
VSLLVPLGAGALAGALLHRRAPAPARLRALLDVLVTAVWSGAAAALLAVLAGGAVGAGRLASVGPSATRFGLAVSLEVAVGALAAVVLLRRRGRAATSPA